MSSPHVYSKSPVAATLESGSHFWCSCGQSEDQPFCDGAHAGTDFGPKKFFVAEKTQAYLCNCKHTKNAPYCDGSHKQIQ